MEQITENTYKYCSEKYTEWMQLAIDEINEKHHDLAPRRLELAYLYLVRMNRIYTASEFASVEPIKVGPNIIDPVIKCFDMLVKTAGCTVGGVKVINNELYNETLELRKAGATCLSSDIRNILLDIEKAHMDLRELVSATYVPESEHEPDIIPEEFHDQCEDEWKYRRKKEKDSAKTSCNSEISKEERRRMAKEKNALIKDLDAYSKEYIKLMRKLSELFVHKRYDKIVETVNGLEKDYAASMIQTLDKIRDSVYMSLVQLSASCVRSMVAATSVCANKIKLEYDSIAFLAKIMHIQKICVNHKEDGYTPQKLATIAKIMEPMHDACMSMTIADGFIRYIVSAAEQLSSQLATEDADELIYDETDVQVISESCKDTATARAFVAEVRDIAKKYNANFFVVTDGASAYHNGDGSNNPAVKNARDKHVEWEKKNGLDPNEDWAKNEDCDTEVFTEASLSESFMFQKLNDNSSITTRIADIIRTGMVVERSFIEEQYYQMSKTRLSPLVDKVLDAYDKDDIMLIYNKNVHLTVALPFVVMQFKGKFRALIFISDFSSLNKDGTAFSIEMKKLYTLMEAALVGLTYYTKPNTLQRSSVVSKLTSAIYAEMGLRILNKEFALSLDKNAYDMVNYSMARFYLTKIFGLTSQEVIDTYSRDACKSPDNTSMEMVKNMYDDTPIDNLEDLLKFFAKLYPKMERLTFRYYLQRWISSYLIGSTLAIDNFPYLYYVIISVLLGSFMINNTALNDPIKNMKGMQHFHGEISKLI